MKTARTLFAFCILHFAFSNCVSASTLDSFDSIAAWKAAPAQGVEMHLSKEAGRHGAALRIDFDFHGHGGYAIARREVPVELPPNFEFSFSLRGDAPRNTLEFKLIDPTGQNVWWHTKREFDFPREWKRIVIRRSQIAFAWGPLGGGELPRRIGSLEIVVTAGTGGKGTVWIDDLALSPIESTSVLPPPYGPFRKGRDFTIDMKRRRELGGFTIEWDRPVAYTVYLDGEKVRDVAGRKNYVDTPDADGRVIRIASRQPATLVKLTPHEIAWSKTPNDFFHSIAEESQRGSYPRYLYDQQSYWTIVGADGSAVEALVGEDGAVELGNARCSIEPFVWKDGRLITWSDVTPAQSLERGDLPVPSVEWPGVLGMTAWVDAASTLFVRYTIPKGAELFVAIRPLQVNTPWQFLNRTGGVVKIRHIAFGHGRVDVDADERISIDATPDAFGAMRFDGGNIVDLLRKGSVPAAQAITDDYGYASAAMRFNSSEVTLRIPLLAAAAPASPALSWPEKLDTVRIDIPDRKLADSIRTNLAYILINRDGPAIQPGSRSYDRSWIRDGSLTSTALLRLGHYDEVRDFINWYARFQYASGAIPCCVGKAGADPVPENDSHGEFIYLIAEYYRHTHDRALVEKQWAAIEKTVAYIDSLRHERLTKQYEGTPEYGLVPASISHEGYSAKPMHSYWDDFFILRGLKDAAYLAAELGRTTDYASMRDEFERDLLASIDLSMRQHAIDYIPGAAELGDFDPASTTIALEPVGEAEKLPHEALLRTFDRYFQHALEPRQYTPYEWRIVGALIRMGQKERALQLVRYFFRDQRPSAWNEWAEVVRPDVRKPGFIGDMPHSWVGSDFIRSALDLFAYENDEGTLVIGAGIDESWLDAGVSIDNLSTHAGRLGYTMKRSGDTVSVDFLRAPAGAVIIRSPLSGPIHGATADGQPVDYAAGEIRLARVPHHIDIIY